MRCIGATNPPCARCVKSNRECIVRLPNRNQHRNQHRLSTRLGSKSPADRPRRNPESDLQSPNLDQTPLPSIFSSPPITIATTESDYRSGGDSGSYDAILLNEVPDSIIFDLVEL
ncbi:uncharacterized protein N7458_006102 [Penicillium daleae]|uniref:Zn(2)-C6 fungal-type domain-containing protein n=1 Tax=Penicillium daleae TaxID=63821 RepID=A0AAD6G2A1_9EURO|nr:uncharacterized protein N7458_006102 [Penicillium daleae]KAJ5449653.1 hypothetical protein N7458_006102 [Penicillium daleae]